MVPSSKNEAFLPVDNLQLGHTDVNPEDVQSAEQKIKQLKEQVKQVWRERESAYCTCRKFGGIKFRQISQN